MEIHKTSSSVITNSIKAATQDFMAAFRSKDANAMARLYAEDAEVMPPHADVVRGRDAIRALWQEFIQAGIREIRLTTAEVSEGEDLAFESGRYDIIGDTGQSMDKGKYIVVWRQEGGSWKLYRDIWNSSMPAAH